LNLVCKLDKDFIEGKHEEAYKCAMNRWVSQIYSIYMAKYFRKLSCKHNAPPIFFLPPILYQLETPFKGTKILYAEPYIDQTEWKKYSNNYDFCQNQSMATFSHFTHVASLESFMITDLQGSGCLLSDPAIHSENTELFNEKTNLKTEGFDRFYISSDYHPKCNQLCAHLGLNTKRRDGVESVINIEEDEELKFEDGVDINIICELC
jgi:hypothetical protein